MPTPKSQSLSLALHGLAVAVLLALNSTGLLQPPAERPIIPPLSRTLIFTPPPRPTAAPAGGSTGSSQPARYGAPPPRAPRTFILPQTVSDPKLIVPAGVEFDTPAVVMTASEFGDPLSKLALGGLGPGKPDGTGKSGCCGGPGDGIGGPGTGSRHPTTPPRLIYKVEPEFSEEARKAKYQGTVVLTIEVDAAGKPSHFAVVSSLGLGLDQKAMEAVAQWRFQPAYRDGKPLPTTARIEVNFRLM